MSKRVPRWMGALRRQTKRAPRWTARIAQKTKRAPRWMGALGEIARRAPRCMGTLFCTTASANRPKWVSLKVAETIIFISFRTLFQCDHKSAGAEVTPSTLSARPDPASQKGNPRRRPKAPRGERRILENKAPERPTGKTQLQEMEGTATDYRKTKRESVQDATR